MAKQILLRDLGAGWPGAHRDLQAAGLALTSSPTQLHQRQNSFNCRICFWNQMLKETYRKDGKGSFYKRVQ